MKIDIVFEPRHWAMGFCFSRVPVLSAQCGEDRFFCYRTAPMVSLFILPTIIIHCFFTGPEPEQIPEELAPPEPEPA